MTLLKKGANNIIEKRSVEKIIDIKEEMLKNAADCKKKQAIFFNKILKKAFHFYNKVI